MRSKETRTVSFLFSSFRAGGGERVMVEVANALAAKGYGVHAVVLKRVGEYGGHLDSRIRVFDMDAWRMLFSLPKLILYLVRERPSAIIATDEHTHILALMARYLSGARTRVVFRIGNMYTELYGRYTDLKHALMLRFMRSWYRHADHIIANSKGVADDVRVLTGIAQERLSVIYNPKPVTRIHSLMEEPVDHPWLTDKQVPVVVTHGRLREQKNLEFLIRAFAKATKAVPARLMLVGSGRDADRLKDVVRELGLEDCVELTGYAENPYAFLSRADVYVSASLWEGMSNSLIEALICGLAVVASDCQSGPREVLAPTTDYRARLANGSECAEFGILTAVNDEQALIDSLVSLIGDPALRQKYSMKSFERMRDFDESLLVPAYEKVLLDLS